MEKLYSVKLPSTGKYILWCDECWYETTPVPNCNFTEEQAKAIVKQLRNHYTYNAIVVDKDGVELAKPAAVNPMTTVKKSFFRKF